MTTKNFWDNRQVLTRTLNYFATITLALLLTNCKKNYDYRTDVTVTSKNDTLSNFYYEGNRKYALYDSSYVDSAFFDKSTPSKLPGQYWLGIKGRQQNPNRYLVFRTLKSELDYPKEFQVPFFKKEFLSTSDYKIEIYENYTDTTENPPRKYETYVAIDKKTNDTILYQETNYSFSKDNRLVTCFIVYDNFDTREEMRLLIGDFIDTVKESVKNENQKSK